MPAVVHASGGPPAGFGIEPGRPKQLSSMTISFPVTGMPHPYTERHSRKGKTPPVERMRLSFKQTRAMGYAAGTDTIILQ